MKKSNTTRFIIATPLLLASQVSLAAGTTERLSLFQNTVQANNSSVLFDSTISADGRYVAFSSLATNLVANDTNGKRDIFLRDRQTNTTTRISISSGGVQGNGESSAPTISANGRFVSFLSDATNLVSGDTNARRDVFIHDIINKTTTRVNLSSANAQANSGNSYNSNISANGRFVVFDSSATNLITSDTNNAFDVFIRDRQLNTTSRISISSTGEQANKSSFDPVISEDGRYIAFNSGASNLVENDTNGTEDTFVYDRFTQKTTRVSIDSTGKQSSGFSFDPHISANGRFVVFRSDSKDLVANDTNKDIDVFVHDRTTKSTSRISVASNGSQANGYSVNPNISADGRYVTFFSFASNLVANDTNNTNDIFVRDRQTNTTTRVSLRNNGGQAAGGVSLYPSISSDGRFIAFASTATNLVTDDTNGQQDIFVRDRFLNTTVKSNLRVLQTVAPTITLGNNASFEIQVKNQGPDVASLVTLTNIVPENGVLQDAITTNGACVKSPIVICRLGSLNSGITAIVKVTIKSTEKGLLTNTATVNSSAVDLAPTNNTSVKSTTVK